MIGPDQLEADRLEASSSRYVIGLRLQLLNSGNWAVWYGGEQGLSTVEIVEEIDLGWLRSVAEKERELRHETWKEIETRREYLRLRDWGGTDEAGGVEQMKSEKNAGELGL